MRVLLAIVVALGSSRCALTTPTDAGAPARRDDLPGLDERFQRAAFEYADGVLRVQVEKDGAATELERLRGFSLPTQPKLRGLAQDDASREFFVAVDRCPDSLTALCVRAALLVTADSRRLVEAWALPAWKHAPLVAVVRADETPASDGRSTFTVEEVLRGDLFAHRLAAHWSRVGELFSSVSRADRYLLTASSISRDAVPIVWPLSLQPVDQEELARVRRVIKSEPFLVPADLAAATRATLRSVEQAWIAHEAPLVAEVSVGSVYTDMFSAVGGRWATLVPAEWFRGPTGPLATTDRWQSPWRQAGPPDPYLFVTGGRGFYRPLTAPRYLVAGWEVGGRPHLLTESSAAARAVLVQALAAPTPRFAARPVAELQHLRPAPEGDSRLFEPSLPLETLAVQSHLSATRFEVADRGELPGGGAWIRCRSLPTFGLPGGDEWLFEGRGLPDWPVGARIVGHSVDGWRPSQWSSSLAERRALFLPDLFVPGDRDVEALRSNMTGELALPREDEPEFGGSGPE